MRNRYRPQKERLRLANPGSRWFCGWCSNPITQAATGRRRIYCSHSCRQRAYENRKVERVQEWVDFHIALTMRARGRLIAIEDCFGPTLLGAAPLLGGVDAARTVIKLVTEGPWDEKRPHLPSFHRPRRRPPAACSMQPDPQSELAPTARGPGG